MLKFIGVCLVIGTATLIGMMLKMQLAEHVKQLVEMREIMQMLSGEISYAKTPLAEAFYNIAARGKETFRGFLTDVAKGLEEEQEKEVVQIWREVFDCHCSDFLFKKDEAELLKGFGENLGYLDVEMQLKHIELYIQQLASRIVQAQQELAGKQRLYQSLSVMCGLFLVLILI